MLTDAEVRAAVTCAVRAPSLHNTQPWLFAAHDDRIEVRTDTSRWLHEEDPLGRELLISCGGAVRHLVLGLRAQGIDVRHDLLPSPVDDPRQVAVVTVLGRRPATAIELELHAAAALRHTDRSRFNDTPPPADLLERLCVIAEREDCFLEVLGTDAAVELAVLTERADRLLHDEPTLRTEQGRWTSDLPRPTEGVPADALPQHGDQRGSPVTLRNFWEDPPDAPVPGSEPPAPEHPALVVLGTETDDRLAWLRSGWTLSELLLTLTVEGLAASPLTQALEIAGLRSRLRTVLGLHGSPQMALRVGYPVGPGSAQTGRRPIDEVLC